MFNGNIKPGEQLKEAALSQSLSVSRSTIREALRILTSTGLAVYSPNKGVTARQLTTKEINDIFLTRTVLETAAVRATCDCPSTALENLQIAMDHYATTALTGDSLDSADAHIEYHSAMVGLIGSKYLMRTERAIMQELLLVIASIDQKQNDLDREVRKHKKLTQLLLDRNEPDATQWITDDLSLAQGFAIQQIESQ